MVYIKNEQNAVDVRYAHFLVKQVVFLFRKMKRGSDTQR